MLVEDLAVDALELCSRNRSYSSVQVVSEPNHPQVDLLEGCGFFLLVKEKTQIF